MSRRARQEFETELNLAPFIDVFMTLIAFVLLSTVFIHLSHIKVHTPGSSADQGASPVGFQIYAQLSDQGLEIRTYDLEAQVERDDLSTKGALTSQDQWKNIFATFEPLRSQIKGILLKGRDDGSVQDTLQVVEAFRAFDSSIPLVIVTEALE